MAAANLCPSCQRTFLKPSELRRHLARKTPCGPPAGGPALADFAQSSLPAAVQTQPALELPAAVQTLPALELPAAAVQPALELPAAVQTAPARKPPAQPHGRAGREQAPTAPPQLYQFAAGSVVRLRDHAEAVCKMFASAAFAAYCNRTAAQRVVEKYSIGPVTSAVIGLLKLSHKTPESRNIYADQDSVYIFDTMWTVCDIQTAADSIIADAAAAVWQLLMRADAAHIFSPTIRCAMSCAAMSIRHCSPEWAAQLRASVCTALSAYLPTAAARTVRAAQQLMEAAPRPVPAARAPAPRAPPPRPRLTLELVAALLRGAPADGAADWLEARTAAELGCEPSRDLRERLEQKLWEAASDGIIDNGPATARLRQCLLRM